jgi:hypothetical protein
MKNVAPANLGAIPTFLEGTEKIRVINNYQPNPGQESKRGPLNNGTPGILAKTQVSDDGGSSD